MLKKLPLKINQSLLLLVKVYSRTIDFKKSEKYVTRFALIFSGHGHFSGLVAGGAYPNPVKYADAVTLQLIKFLGDQEVEWFIIRRFI